MNIKDRLIEFIKIKVQNSGKTRSGELNENSSLIKSGLLDSLALLELGIWIENEINSQIDITSVNIREDWDSVTNILKFIEKRPNS